MTLFEGSRTPKNLLAKKESFEMKEKVKHFAKLEKNREAVKEMAIRLSTELRGRPPTVGELEKLEAKLDKRFRIVDPDS